MADMTASTSNLAEDVVGVGDGVEAGAAAAGERLMCRTTVTTAATTENLCLSVEVAEDVGVAERGLGLGLGLGLWVTGNTVSCMFVSS